ncbi:MAG: hypothetical protein PWQ67_2489 [Clostridia bacterium]|jgi:hypothetical protein|nr:hypothetical protein [Clostridia bacterium]MDN5324035.1 hypothetical protein [Clostridia bacterium]
MFDHNLYPFIITSMVGGLLTLLGSVGIFISIIIQRKVERLQAILEEFIDLSYQSDLNLSGKMFNLIEKYQMHYILPDNPRQIIIGYINITIGLVIALWLGLYILGYESPFHWLAILYLLPLIVIGLIMIWFRRLLQYLINIDETPLLGSIIPAPKRLRSISYLSSFINVSVKSVLKQARLNLLFKKCDVDNPSSLWMVVLKEELSFDDFFYFLVCFNEKNPIFLSFGEIVFDFPRDGITGKPSPVKKNVNIPLGELNITDEPEELQANMLIFTKGEKYPLNFNYKLKKGGTYYAPSDNPEVSIDHQITYSIEKNMINIIKNESSFPFIKKFASLFKLNGTRLYLPKVEEGKVNKDNLKTSHELVFID